jgi:CP family cyanate transporter-like MFS transporter
MVVSVVSKEGVQTVLARPSRVLLYTAIILLAANLRPAITGVGPLIGQIGRGTGLSPELAGLVTTLPLIAFGLVSPLAPRTAQRLGLERTVFVGVAVLGAGTLVRTLGSTAALLAGMVLVGGGVAVGNVLLPSLIKRDFPDKVGLMTGLYVTVMNVFAGLGSGLSVPLARRWNWQGSLAFWLVLVVAALAVWLPLLRGRYLPETSQRGGFWRSPLAWQMTLFMGLQSLLFYVNIAWLPTLLHSRGFSLAASGWLVSLVQIVSLPGTFIMPILAQRQRRQHSLVAATALMFLIGYVGLLATKSHWWSVASVLFVGFGSGVSISLALAFFSLRTQSHQSAGQVSGMAQSVGYLLAAAGPLLVGLLYARNDSWTGPLLLLVAAVLLMTWAGFGASRDLFVEDRALPRRSP